MNKGLHLQKGGMIRQNLFMENILARGCHNVAKGVTALCLLRPYLPLTRLTGKGECAGATTVATARAEENRTQSLWRTLGFPETHDVSFRQFEKKRVNIYEEYYV